ncbi:hypothetical protein L9F63_008652, partial [Diploptera punctata]
MGGWKGRRGRGRGGGPRTHFGAGNQFNVHPQQQQQQMQHQQQQQQMQHHHQQQQFGGPQFGQGAPGFPHPPHRGGMRGAPVYNRPQMNQQPPQQQQPLPPPPQPQQQLPQQQIPQQPPQQQHQQSPHKILINPHFRGAVQPHPEARLIWDPDMSGNPPPQAPEGDGVVPFSPDVQPLEVHYQQGYAVQQFQPPPQHQQLEQHQVPPSPHYDSSSQQGAYYPPEQTYSDPQTTPHWQDSEQVNNTYIQPSPAMGIEPVGHQEGVFHQTMGDNGINHSIGGGVYGGGMVQYEGVPQQHGMYVEEGSYPPSGMPPQHYHLQQPPPPMSPGGHRLPPPMMGAFRLTGPPPGGMKFRHPNQTHFPQPPGPGYMNQGGRPPRGGMRYASGPQMNMQHQQMMRPRRPPGPPMHMVQQQQMSQPQPQQQQQLNRSLKKRPSFEGGSGNAQFKQARFDASLKRKKRMPDMSNLHEVQTVDMLPSDMNYQQMPEEEEDEETRRKNDVNWQLLEKQRELEKKNVDVQAGGDAPDMQFEFEPPQGNAIATIVNRNTVEPQPVMIQAPVRQIQQQQPIQQIQVQNVNRIPVQQQFHQDLELPQPPSVPQVVRFVGPPTEGRRRVSSDRHNISRQRKDLYEESMFIINPNTEVEVPVPGQRIVRAPQPGVTAVAQSAGPPRRLVLAQGAGHPVAQMPRQVVQQAPAPKGRTVVLRGATGGSKPSPQQQPQQPQQQAQQAQPQGTASRQPAGGRSVVATKAVPPQQQGMIPQQPVLPKTKTVSIENLAASTSAQQLKALCQGIGVLENIQMLPKQRRAILKFANPTSAATFYKRYQRKIIDLSLISVSLVPYFFMN